MNHLSTIALKSPLLVLKNFLSIQVWFTGIVQAPAANQGSHGIGCNVEDFRSLRDSHKVSGIKDKTGCPISYLVTGIVIYYSFTRWHYTGNLQEVSKEIYSLHGEFGKGFC